MTREEAYKKLCKLPVGHTMDYIALATAKNLIDQIFDQQNKLEAELKAYKAKIDELKEYCKNKILNTPKESLEAVVFIDTYTDILQKLEELDK